MEKRVNGVQSRYKDALEEGSTRNSEIGQPGFIEKTIVKISGLIPEKIKNFFCEPGEHNSRVRYRESDQEESP